MKCLLLIGAALLALSSAASAQDLKELSDFAQSICGDIPEGTYTKTAIQGKVGANAGLLAKLVSGNAEVSAERKDEVYKGIPFDKLPDNIPTVAMCKSELIKVILARKKVTLNKCRMKDFGQEGWNQTEKYSNSSSWMGGGHDQGQWCNQVANSFIASRQLGPLSTWTKLTSGEDSHKDTFGHVTYKYSCTVQVSWDPKYVEKEDARCGVTEQ